MGGPRAESGSLFLSCLLFVVCCCHCLVTPVFTLFRVNRKFLLLFLNRLVMFWFQA